MHAAAHDRANESRGGASPLGILKPGTFLALPGRSMWESKLLVLTGDGLRDQERIGTWTDDGWTLAVVVTYRYERHAFLMRWKDTPDGQPDHPS